MKEAEKEMLRRKETKKRRVVKEHKTEFLECTSCSGVREQLPYKGISCAVSVWTTSRAIATINMYEVRHM
jgi:hypothetical protein